MGVIQKYALEDLLRVRRLREDAAAKQWAKQKEVVAAAEKQLERRRKELSEYQAWRIRREAEMFQEVVNQTIHPKDLEKLRFRIQKLRDEESNYRSSVLESENRLQAEQEKLAEDREKYFAAYRQRDKLDEHKAIWRRDAARAREAAEEKEVEDFKNHLVSFETEGA